MVAQSSEVTGSRDAAARAESLLKSLKGIADARVEVDAQGQVRRVQVMPAGIDERAAVRNAQSALMAVLGEHVEAKRIAVLDFFAPVSENGISAVRPAESVPVLELRPPARRPDLNEAARVAFETLRAAQASFHGFSFDGAELVRINGSQYVVVAVRRAASEARHCGAAPVLESVAGASARALMNAVGAAAMNSVQLELQAGGDQYELLNA